MSNVRKFLTAIIVALSLVFVALGVTAVVSAVYNGGSSAIEVMAEETSGSSDATVETTETAEVEEDNATSSKAIAAGIAIGVAALGGAVSMGIAISKSAESIARQPEAEGKIRTTLMLGLVFIETAIIYALIVAILIIFVL